MPMPAEEFERLYRSLGTTAELVATSDRLISHHGRD